MCAPGPFGPKTNVAAEIAVVFITPTAFTWALFCTTGKRQAYETFARLLIPTSTLFLASLEKEPNGAVQSVQTLQTSALNSFDGGRCQGGFTFVAA